MDNVDFTFMKSGHDLLEKKDETLENVGSIAMVFMENAIRNANIYIKHAKRPSITPEDIKRGFMLEVFFMKSRPNMKEQCIEMKKKILEIIKDEEENGETVFIDDEGEENSTEKDEPFTESACECPMCTCFNTIYTRWENFPPELPLDNILVQCINEIS